MTLTARQHSAITPSQSHEHQGNAAVTQVQHPDPCQTLQNEWAAALMGTIKEGGSYYPPDCTYSPSFTPDLFGISMGLNSCRSQTFPGFPLTLPF